MARVPHYDGSEDDFKGHVFPYDYTGGITGHGAASYRAVVKAMKLTSFTGMSFVTNVYPGKRNFWDSFFNRREVIGEIRVEQAFPLVEIDGEIKQCIDDGAFRQRQWFVAR